MTTITLTPKQHETLRRAQLTEAAQQLRIAADYVSALAEAAELAGDGAQCAKLSLRLVREDLDAIDALGWPGID